MKRILTVILFSLLLAAPAAMQAQFTYFTTAGAITITGYFGPGGAVDIPASTNGLPVTSIGNEAFLDSTNMSSVNIPDSITSIGVEAFSFCTGLTNVTIPEFVTSIGDAAFTFCTNLTAINVDTQNLFYSSVNGVLFDISHSTLIEFPDGLGGSYAIPAFVTSIGDGCFFDCANLTSVTIPVGVTSIGDEAFFLCTSLTNVTISDSVTNIGEEAFSYCASLASVAIPASVTTIGEEAFTFSHSLTAINVDAQNLFYSSTNGVLFDKSQSTLVEYPNGLAGSYIIPGGVTSIGDDAFEDSTNLSRVTVPDSVTSIGSNAFVDCSSLTEAMIGTGVTNIGATAFASCTDLTIVFFRGNPPTADSSVFLFDTIATVYYLASATGWSSPFADLPAVLWNPMIQASGPLFGVRSNQFGFNITGTTNIPLVVEASTNLASPVWTSLQTIILSNGLFYFSEPLQTTRSARYYRLSSP